MMRKNTVKVNHVRDKWGNEEWRLTVTPEFYKDWMDDKLLFYMAGPYKPVGKFEKYFVDGNPISHMFADKEKVIASGEFREIPHGTYESIEKMGSGKKMILWDRANCFHISSHYLPRSGNYRLNVGILIGGNF